MKQTLPSFISTLLVLFAWCTGDLKANPEFLRGTEYTATTIDDLFPSMPNNQCYTPDWTYTYDITENSATWEWATIYGCTGYYVQWRYPNGTWYDLPGMCYQNWVHVTNLNPATHYEWRVRAYCGNYYYSNWCNPTYFTTNGYYCNYPEWLSCYNITGYSATWKWAGCYGADYYWVQWRYPGGGWTDLYGCPVYGTWVNVNHLQPCTSYEYRVRSHCYNGWSNWCYPYSFTTVCNYCPVPYGLYTKDIGNNKATFKWSPVNGAYNYSVQIRDHYGDWHDVPGSPTSGTWITAYNLLSCHTYEWRVRANCGYYDSWGNWSSPQTFTTTCNSGCNAPEWVYTSGISNNSASLHWGPVDGADYYIVEYRPAGGNWTEVPGGPFTNSWAEINGLDPRTTYEWRVKSHCYSGIFSYYSSTTYFTTLGEECGLPFYRYTTPITDSTATLNWSAVPGALNYSVQYRLVNSITWIDVLGSPTTGTSITLTNLLPDTLYEWHMKVNCSNGASSPWLSAINFHTSNTSGCEKPTGLTVDSLTLTSVRLSWSAVEDAVTYSLEIRKLPNGTWIPVSGSPVDTTYIDIDSLNPHTTYEVRVRTNCTGGFHSFYTNGVQFTTTDLPPCHAPVGLGVDSTTETTASLYWSPVPGVFGYKVQIRLPNGIWIDVGGLMVDTTIFVTGLTPNTTYEWHVKSKCADDNFSNWSTPGTFTTAGSGSGVPNDECANATLLTVGDTCVTTFASNVDATSSLPAPAGGCPSAGNKDVWFRFTMPDVVNPTVTIRTGAGSLADAVMEVYTGAGCNILSVITCEDNNDNGNGSMMPVINLTGTPGATIWVRVWGRDGATGTFTLCVFNDVSFNYTDGPRAEVSDEGQQLNAPEEVTPTQVDVVDQPVLSVTPNPVNDHLNVTVRQTDESRVIGWRILDYSGKVILNKNIEAAAENQFRSSVDVSTLAPGMYVLQVQTTSGILVEKITVVR